MIPHSRDLGKPESLRTARFTGLVDPAWREIIDGLIETTPQDAGPEGWADWTEVKRSTVRTIQTGALSGPGEAPVPVHLKLFRAVRLSDRARDAIHGSRSAREFHNLRAALDRGLPCVRPVAALTATGSCGSRSFLLTLTEAGSALARGPLDPADAAAAGRLLRKVHDAGLHARDLHAGNLLRRPDGELLLLDLTSASFGDELTEQERGRALAFFCLDLDGIVRDPAARPLIKAYGASAAVLRFAVQAGRRLRNRSVSAFGRRAFRPCATTEVERANRRPRWSWHRPAAALFAAAREAIAGLGAARPLKSGRRGGVYRFPEVVVKERSAAAARRLFESAYWLTFARVPTPMPVAVTTFRSRGATATARLPNRNLLEELRDGLPEESLLAAAANLGGAVGRLHSFGLRNRDLKFENLVRLPESETVHMVDLDGVRRQVPGDNRGRANDLGRLLAAFEHAGRPGGDAVVRAFLREYVRACRRLLQPVPHRSEVLARAATHARSWAEAHA